MISGVYFMWMEIEGKIKLTINDDLPLIHGFDAVIFGVTIKIHEVIYTRVCKVWLFFLAGLIHSLFKYSEPDVCFSVQWWLVTPSVIIMFTRLKCIIGSCKNFPRLKFPFQIFRWFSVGDVRFLQSLFTSRSYLWSFKGATESHWKLQDIAEA